MNRAEPISLSCKGTTYPISFLRKKRFKQPNQRGRRKKQLQMKKAILAKAGEKNFQASREIEKNQMGGGNQQSTKGLPDYLMYKNKLQEITQRSGLNFPDYQTVNEGFQHAPKFKCTVIVNGASYSSGNVFSHKKVAEQDAAKYALACIEDTLKDNEISNVPKDSKLFKSILIEFAVQTNQERPYYNTIQTDLLHPSFACALTFGGETYTSGAAKSKKDAEQLAARNAIDSLLASGSETLSQIICSKNKASVIKKIEHQVNERRGSSGQPITSLPPSPGTPNLNPRVNHNCLSNQHKQKRDQDENWAAKKPRGC